MELNVLYNSRGLNYDIVQPRFREVDPIEYKTLSLHPTAKFRFSKRENLKFILLAGINVEAILDKSPFYDNTTFKDDCFTSEYRSYYELYYLNVNSWTFGPRYGFGFEYSDNTTAFSMSFLPDFMLSQLFTKGDLNYFIMGFSINAGFSFKINKGDYLR